jgi:DNA polymerase I
MQGTAADIIKLAMLRVERECAARRLAARLIMQVHDELVLEVAENAVDATAAMVREQMAAAETLKVPLKVDIGTGANWDQAH